MRVNVAENLSLPSKDVTPISNLKCHSILHPSIVGIYPLICAKAPTLDQPDHRVEFMVRGICQPRLA